MSSKWVVGVLGMMLNTPAFDSSDEDNCFHIVLAAGYTAKVEMFSVPVQVTYISDVSGY